MKLTTLEKLEKKKMEIIELNETLYHLKQYEQRLSMGTPVDMDKLREVKNQIKSVQRKIRTREYATYELQTRLANNR